MFQLLILQAANRPFYIVVHNVSCTTHGALLAYCLVDMHMANVSRYSLNTKFEFRRDMPRTTEVNILIHFRFQTGGKTIKFMDVKMNVCEMLAHVSTIPMIKDILIKYKQASNLPIGCPLKAVSNFLVYT